LHGKKEKGKEKEEIDLLAIINSVPTILGRN